MADENQPGERPFPARLVELPGGYRISDDRARLDMAVVHRAIAQAYWAIGRPREVTDRAWANSLCFGVYDPLGGLVGFGRVLTDYALRAHIADVYVQPDARGLGLGKAMIDAMLSHPELATVVRWTLTTSDAQDLYRRFGFRVADADPTWMCLKRDTR